jgi:hypothetical protein
MIYHYTLLMLYRPTKDNVMGSAGDWSVQASTQACLMFRRTQIDRQIAQPWLAVSALQTTLSCSLTVIALGTIPVWYYPSILFLGYCTIRQDCEL